MCGIAGVVWSDPHRPADGDLLERMCARIHHRGPDDSGTLVHGPAALGVKRLSIIDVAGGHQPIWNEDRTRAIVFNGEIYNYRELRPGLVARGHRFTTESDTEVILHLYEEEGAACVERLRGMFAFAIYDRETRSILLARDQVGIKPLYYIVEPDRLLFASEVKALLAAGIDRAIDPLALDLFLCYRYIPGERTIFSTVHKLPPGHVAHYRGGSLETRRYWRLEIDGGVQVSDPAEATHRLLDQSVRLHLRSDVPVGAFLSGGIDSSALVALMMRYRPQGEPVRTFSVGFEDPKFQEFEYSREVARALGTEHTELLLTDDDYAAALDDFIWFVDQPMADPASLPVMLLSRKAKESVTVVLSGEGGDEVFLGYSQYARALQALESRGQEAAIDAFIAGSRYFGAVNRTLLRGDLQEDLRKHDPLRRIRDALGATEGTLLRRMLRADLETWMPDNLLVKADTMSMAASIETRVPYLDIDLVGFTLALPDRVQTPRTARSLFHRPRLLTKPLLRAIAKGLVPRRILGREKVGFPVPFARILAGPLRGRAEETFASGAFAERGLFDPEAVRERFRRLLAGDRKEAFPVWMAFCFERFCTAFVDESHEERGSAMAGHLSPLA
ncbi:MAG TPA: asparagine synthase (glutamine-hydrolyzing) [Candidatus Polarisedimenticolia bacterium]|jgi:asparagine synthase (glutamine-hydrolysing)|nr:asparagine synthase (glutamine-hydrolyzing) [Candidatus Polarisedimenticolia bacterium]